MATKRKRLIGIGSGYAKPLELNYKWILDNVNRLGINCVRFWIVYFHEQLTDSHLSKIYDFCSYAKGKAIIVVVSLSDKRVSSSSSDWPGQAENITRIYDKLKGLDNIIYETGNELTQGYDYEKKIVDKLRALGAEEIMSSALRDQDKIKPYVDYFSYHTICGTAAINKEIGPKTVYDTDGCNFSILTPDNLYEMTKKALQRDSHLFFDEGLKEDGSFTDEARIRALRKAKDDIVEPPIPPPPPPPPEAEWETNLIAYPGFRGKEDLTGWTLAYGKPHIYCAGVGGHRGRTGVCEATDAEIDPTEIYQVVNVSSFAGSIDTKGAKAKVGTWVRKYSEPERVRLIYEYKDAEDKILASYDTDWFTGFWGPDWHLYEDERVLPVGTRSIKVRLIWGYKLGSSNDNAMTDAYVKLYPVVEPPPPPEEITTTTITCPNCGSTLELSISSISVKNIQQNCPLCGEPAD